MKPMNQAWNRSGSSSRNTRLNVSWLGTTCSSLRNSCKNSSFDRPNSAMSAQVSPPLSSVQNPITRISCSSCRFAFPVRGSSKSSKISSNSSMALHPPLSVPFGRILPTPPAQYIFSNAIPLDLTRFDLDFDLPDHFLPEFPAPIFLTTRPDLGDVSQGNLVTIANHYALFNGILNPKQLEGLRLLVTPFPQQQFNQTEDRRTEVPSRGVTCFDCHANGHTNAATHLVGDIRPQQFRHRIDTPTLRGVNIQRLFGSQRGLKTVEDFTEFEQRAAWFDGDPVIAAKKGVNILDRGSQVHAMAEFQELLDFPPAPKLGIDGKLDPKIASPAELRGQAIFFGKGTCVNCHAAPYYTDNSMHNLRTERFYKPVLINGRMASADGPIKTFPLRGIKDSPPYLHDGRLLPLDDTVEFFNVVLGTQLTTQEKQDLAAFLRVL